MHGICLHKSKTITEDSGFNQLLLISSFPPRECGIATYSDDLIKALNNAIGSGLKITVCPIESDSEKHIYDSSVQYILNTSEAGSFCKLSGLINNNSSIIMVMVQHEFGFFDKTRNEFLLLLKSIHKPVVLTFHTVLPNPDENLYTHVRAIVNEVSGIVVMTHSSAAILIRDYKIDIEKISIIAHGTHLVAHTDKSLLKIKYGFSGKKILSTFGFLSPGKSIETTLYALPDIIKKHPDTLFLIIGKTHPGVLIESGEEYRLKLKALVEDLGLQTKVLFINYFIPLPELLEYLQLTDLYLFTSRDPNQAVSGTFSYAMSCGCAVISTPIPHAKEVLRNDAGILFDFGKSDQLVVAVTNLLDNELLRTTISTNGLHRMASTAWENVAIDHILLFEKYCSGLLHLQYQIPPINLLHIKKMTSGFGMFQFSKINRPDTDSGYTLDDNARALIAFCEHYKLTNDKTDLPYIHIYLNFIGHCLQPEGHYLNYINEDQLFSLQNDKVNLADSNGRATWALGYMLSMQNHFSDSVIKRVEQLLQTTLLNSNTIHSTRAMAFVIKGLYYSNLQTCKPTQISLLNRLTNRLLQMYKHESEPTWHWFESYLTYANSILPEALLCAWIITGNNTYKEVALYSFEFLLSKTFTKERIEVISNKTWLQKEALITNGAKGGEQPIDVAYTIITLYKFYQVFKDKAYLEKMNTAFSWFLGNNHLHRIVYNPCTGGCYDGIEETNVNLNQGAESSVSYLMARLIIEKLREGDRGIY